MVALPNNSRVGEDTPLLVSSDTDAVNHGDPLSRRTIFTSFPGRTKSGWIIPQARSPRAIVAVLCSLVFLGSSAGGFTVIPMTRILEDRFCREYYGVGGEESVDEGLCKVDVVQARLAYLMAVNSFVGAVVGCLVAIPWGGVADRVGRRPVWSLALLGMIVEAAWQMTVVWLSETMSIYLVWLGPLGLVIGGGNAVLNAVSSGMLADVVPESDVALSLMRVHVASMLGNLCSPALASVMMPRTGPWPVLMLSLALSVLPIVGIVFVPETLTLKTENNNDNEDDAREPRTPGARLSRSLAELMDSLSMLRSRSVVVLLLTAVTFMPVVYCTLGFMAQFVSRRYRIPLAYTGYVQAAYGAAHLLVLLVLIPWLSKLALRPSTPLPAWLRAPDERRRDLAFLRWSYTPLALGTALMAVAPSLPVFVAGLLVMSLGSAAGSYVTSVLALCVDGARRTRAFSLLGVAQIVGSLYGMPMLAGLFAAGMRAGGPVWIGLPYLGVAALCMLAMGLLRFVRLDESKDGRGGGDETRSREGDV
ncbi:major facilitator superfamily transporter [Pestalotiopsis sp. NC0098]|nr:major facilitator superfamily transporter [Pestalotiopsis sp. NC0098]